MIEEITTTDIRQQTAFGVGGILFCRTIPCFNSRCVVACLTVVSDVNTHSGDEHV